LEVAGLTQRLEIQVTPEYINDDGYIRRCLSEKTSQKVDRYRIVRRSIDARRKMPRFILQIELDPEQSTEVTGDEFRFAPVAAQPSVIIVGAGPAGLFAALELIENGVKPIILEQGEDVHTRRKRIAQLLRHGTLHPHSNYCFGEGGAGAFSDGKLYTRATKRGNVQKILRLLILHGASPDVLIDAHPHIGSDKLPGVVQKLRETITSCGGEIHFTAKVADFILQKDVLKGVRLEDGADIVADAVILATGHSARDIYRRLHANGIRIEPKPIAVGVRVEHPQALIDTMLYHQSPRPPQLPPATYRVSCQCDKRGVFSFCM
jgi:uncharacterized FAD-dependent dehydrogenase